MQHNLITWTFETFIEHSKIPTTRVSTFDYLSVQWRSNKEQRCKSLCWSGCTARLSMWCQTWQAPNISSLTEFIATHQHNTVQQCSWQLKYCASKHLGGDIDDGNIMGLWPFISPCSMPNTIFNTFHMRLVLKENLGLIARFNVGENRQRPPWAATVILMVDKRKCEGDVSFALF